MDGPDNAGDSVAGVLDDAGAFTAEVRRWLPDMMRLAQRLSDLDAAGDLVQEALSDAWRHRRRFDPAKGSVRNWLLAITARRCKRRHTRSTLPWVTLEDYPGPHDDSDLRIDVERAVSALSRRQQLAIALFYDVDLPVADLATIMHCAEGTAKATLSAARARLARSLEANQ